MANYAVWIVAKNGLRERVIRRAESPHLAVSAVLAQRTGWIHEAVFDLDLPVPMSVFRPRSADPKPVNPRQCQAITTWGQQCARTICADSAVWCTQHDRLAKTVPQPVSTMARPATRPKSNTPSFSQTRYCIDVDTLGPSSTLLGGTLLLTPAYQPFYEMDPYEIDPGPVMFRHVSRG